MTDRNLWRETASESFEAPPLSETAVADLAIIGGGFTGCAAALRAAEAGASVRLLEAETIGHGGSGRNVGLVNAGLWTPPETIAATLGAAPAARLNEALAAAPARVFDRIAAHRIDCAPVRAGTLHCAHAPAGLADLRDRFRQLSAQNAPVAILDAAETAARTGSDAFCAALHDARAGTIEPLSYVRGLARGARDAGAVLHERSPALSIARENGAWCVETPSGALSAERLLIAVNAYRRDLLGAPPLETALVSYFQLATRPLSENLRGAVLPGGEGAWDTATVMTSFRLDAEGRLLLGAVGALDHPGADAHKAWARRKLAALFPALAEHPFEHAWFGRIAMTADHLPKILALDPDAPLSGLSIFGYSGRGIAPGTVFGEAAADALLSGDADVLPLAPIHAYAERFKSLRRLYYEAGATLTHAADRRLAAADDDSPAAPRLSPSRGSSETD